MHTTGICSYTQTQGHLNCNHIDEHKCKKQQKHEYDRKQHIWKNNKHKYKWENKVQAMAMLTLTIKWHKKVINTRKVSTSGTAIQTSEKNDISYNFNLILEHKRVEPITFYVNQISSNTKKLLWNQEIFHMFMGGIICTGKGLTGLPHFSEET